MVVSTAPVPARIALARARSDGGTTGEMACIEPTMTISGRRPLSIRLPPLTSQWEEAAGAVVGAGVKVAASGGDAGVPEGGLHQMNGRPAVEGMGSMGVAEPVGRNVQFDAGARRCLAHHLEHSERPQNPAVALLAGAEDRITWLRAVTSQAAHESPHRSRDLDSPGDAAFSEHRHLAAIGIRLQIPPAEAAQLAHAHAGGVEEGEDRPVTEIRLQAQDAVQIGFRQNALGQAAANCRQTESAANIEWQISGPVGECEQRLNSGQRPVAARRCQRAERVGELLEIGQGHLRQRLAHPCQKVLDVGTIGPLSMPGPAMEPDLEQLFIGISPGRFRQAGKMSRYI